MPKLPLASLASPSKPGWRMSASLVSPSKPCWQMSANLASSTHFQERPFWWVLEFAKNGNFRLVLEFAKFVVEWPSNIIKGKILHDRTFAAAAATATANHFMCNVVKLPITGLPKKKILSRLREKKKEWWEKGKQRQRERKSWTRYSGIPNL